MCRKALWYNEQDFMHLKRLEIQGFKSFAHKMVLEFEPGITAIVGPNGSGKSNIADGLRWVLGEQSAKLMRGKKSDDVIFAGSDKKTRSGFAEIIATFDNRDHKIPVDASEVSLGRRVDRSGESEYLLNGNRVRLLDIVDLVLKSNIGTSRYTVIGQGTIDAMVLSGPADIKNLIDEASGVKTYYIRRDKTLRRLEQTAQNLMRAEDLIAELEPRVKSLRRQAKRMEAREAIEQELKGYRTLAFTAQYWNLRKQSEAVAKELTGVRQQAKQETEKKVDELKSQLGQAQAKHEQAKQQSAGKQRALQDIERELQNLYKQLEKPQAVDWKASQQQLAQLDSSFAALEKSLQNTDSSAWQKSAQGLIDLWQSFRKDWQGVDDNQISLDEVKQQLVSLSAKKDELTAELSKLAITESEAKLSADFLHQQVAAAQQESGATSRDRQTALEVEKAKLDTHLETAVAEIRQTLGDDLLQDIVKLDSENVTTEVASEILDKISKLQHQLDLIGGIDELTLQEYRETEERYTNLFNQVGDLKQSMNDLRSVMDELDEHIKEKFNTAFHKINEQFEHYFRVLFNGGRAYLSLIKATDKASAEETAEEPGVDKDEDNKDQLRPEEKIIAKYEHGSLNVVGVDIRATPPGKKLASIQALSGGERALTSIALLCSMLTCFPSPFVVLDEVDAALDEANTIRFGQILSSLAHQTQFITITHNRETMAHSGTLYGVTMGDDGISKLLSIKLEQAKVYAK